MKTIIESILDDNYDVNADVKGELAIVKKNMSSNHRQGIDVAGNKLKKGDKAWFVDFFENKFHPCIIANPNTNEKYHSIEIILASNIKLFKYGIDDDLYGRSESDNLIVPSYAIVKTKSFR